MSSLAMLGGYGSDSDEDSPQQSTSVAGSVSSSMKVHSAPSVSVDLSKGQSYMDPTITKVFHNPTADAMWRPLQGPDNPHKRNKLGAEQGVVKNAVTGFVEKAHIENFAFDEQYSTFMGLGYAQDPTISAGGNGDRLVGNQDAVAKMRGHTISSSSVKHSKAERQRRKNAARKRKELTGDVADVDTYQGCWAPLFKDPTRDAVIELTDEQKNYVAEQAQKKQKRDKYQDVEVEEVSVFHGKELYDWQGRGYTHPPPELKAKEGRDHKCYIPKKWVHTWKGHSKGVSAIEFFPNTGHLLLSSSMDRTVKIWEVQGQRRCLRTFMGHHEAVRNIEFTQDGRHFLSSSYDRYLKYWDTETGQCVQKFTTGKVPYCHKFYPKNENEFLVGQSNKRVVQWDMRANKTTQEYEEHLGIVNTVTFVDHDTRFVTTSDDKKMFVWEYGIPVVITHIAEPDMHSMPFVAVHPDGKHYVGQSQDNQCLVYTAQNRFKLNRKKRFLGHLNAGYAAQIAFSPDGRYIMSGDAEGRCFFWDWKTSKVFKKLKCHDQVTIGCVWHPVEPSKVATCSWDGTIKLWD